MRCDLCKNDFEERLIEESHDTPCYLFYDSIGRRVKKNKADNYKRHWLCNPCHKKYEFSLNLFLKKQTIKFSERFFNENL